MPEGDAIAHAAARMRPVLEGKVPEAIHTPHPRHAMDRWPERLGGRTIIEVRTHGKHLFIRFSASAGGAQGELTLHSHLRMTGSWAVYAIGQRWRRGAHRAWLVLERDGHQVVQFDGPLLELMTESRIRFDQRLSRLGPDVLAPEFESDRFLARLRGDDQTRGIGDALLDQSNVAGIGNIWKAESCWDAGIDPWRPLSAISDAEALAIIDAVRPRMLESVQGGRGPVDRRVFRLNGRPCRRCGTPIQARGQGDDNRTTFWCPGCQR